MKENPEHERWYREDYLARYPSPPRNKEPLTEDECRKHGLRLVERERYTNEVSFSAEELTSYLMTQSNVVVAIESGAESLESLRTWLTSSLAPMVGRPRGALHKNTFLRRIFVQDGFLHQKSRLRAAGEEKRQVKSTS